MGGSGSSYSKNHKLTQEDIKKRLQREDSDAYLFDVEYQKLKAEQERLAEEYAREREEYLRISEELRQEMSDGTATDADMARFMAVLSDRGVELQERQQKMQGEMDKLVDARADIDQQMEELRKNAFSGATRAYTPVKRNEDYKGFKTEGIGMANAKVVEMRPEEYLRRVAYDFTGGGMENLIKGMSPSAIERYMMAMLRGTKYNPSALNYKGNKTSGTVQALAALMNGYDKIPVMIIE